jgi:hypothetical protein
MTGDVMSHESSRQAPPASPRRDILGFCKSIVEFFTGVTGVVTASVTLLGTVAAILLVPIGTDNPSGAASSTGGTSASASAGHREGNTGQHSDPAGSGGITPTPEATPDQGQAREDWVRFISEECNGVTQLGELGAASTGTLDAYSAALSIIADELVTEATPDDLRDAAASAADDFREASTAAANGDAASTQQLMLSGATTLSAAGVPC